MKSIKQALKDGLDVIPLNTKEEEDQARREWGPCKHRPPRASYDDPYLHALGLLGLE